MLDFETTRNFKTAIFSNDASSLSEIFDLKYKLTDETIIFKAQKLYRIKALKDFGDVKKGDLGGFIKNESCLDHQGLCWVYDNAKVLSDGRVVGDAKVTHDAVVFKGKIFSNGIVSHSAIILDGSVGKDSKVLDNAQISGDAIIDESKVLKNGKVHGFELRKSKVSDNAKVEGHGRLYGSSVYGEAIIRDRVHIYDMEIGGRVVLSDRMYLSGPGKILDENEVLYISGLPLDKNITMFRCDGKIKMFVGAFEAFDNHHIYNNNFHNHLIRMAYQMGQFHFNNPKF